MKFSGLVFWVLCAASFAPYANENVTPEIVDLTEQKTFRIESLKLINDSDFTFLVESPSNIVVQASQDVADIVLTATNCGTSFRQVDVPAIFRQPEIIAFQAVHEGECLVNVAGKGLVDKKSRTNIQIKVIESPRIWHSYQTASDAGMAWLESQNSEDDETLLFEAFELYQAGSDLSVESGKADIHLLNLYQSSVVSHYLSDYTKQAEILLELLSLSPSDSRLRIAAWLDLASHFFYDENDREKAEKMLNEILKVANKERYPLYYADALEAQVSMQVKEAVYSDAIETYHFTYDIFLANGALVNALNTALSLGYFYSKSGDFLNASAQFNSALILANQLEEKYAISNANIKLSRVYRNLGQFDLADSYISEALEISSNFPHSSLSAWAHQEKGELLAATEQILFAIDHYEQARAAYEKIADMDEARKLDLTLAALYLETGSFDAAISLLTEFKTYATKHLTEFDIAKAKAKIAAFFIATNEPLKAIQIQKEIVAVVREKEDVLELAKLLQNMALSEALLGNSVSSNEYFTEGMDLFQKLNTDVEYISGLYRYAKALEQHAPKKSESIIQLATFEMLEIHEHIERKDLRRGFLANFQSLVSSRIRIDKSLSKIDALFLAELVRAEGLGRNFSEDSMSLDDSAANNLKLSKLNEKLSRQFVALQEAINNEDRRGTMRELRLLSEQRYKLERDILKNLNATENQSLPIFDKSQLQLLQQRISEKTLVLFLDTAELQSHTWRINHNSVTYHAIAEEKILKDSTATLLSKIKQQYGMSAINDELMSLSEYLFGTEGFPEHVTDLIIISDGPLANFPISLLRNPATGKYLYETKSLSQHHSLKALLNQMGNKTDHNSFSNALVVANPEMRQTNNLSEGAFGYAATNLPYSELEAKSIQKLLIGSTKILSNRDATKDRIKEITISDYDIIHFATHAVANSEVPELGGLVLSNFSESNNLLLTPEIKRLKINASLVVLSGCETTEGKSIAGEGILGLSRAFFESGAKNVLGSLWQVQDDATAMLISRFYNYLLTEKLPMSSALIAAQNDVRQYRRKDGRKPWQAPFYWAGFVLHGSGV